MTLNFDAPIKQKSAVEIASQLDYYLLQRRKVQYRKDNEAVQVRATCKEWEKKLRAERARRKREGVECPACGGVGSHGLSPDGDHLYCEGCAKGIRFYLDEIDGTADAISGVLRLNEPLIVFDLSVLEERLQALTVEHDRLTGLLEVLRRAG